MGAADLVDRRRRRAHGPSRDGRRGRLQPPLRQRAADRRERRRDGPDGREPPRRVPAADEGGSRPRTRSRASVAAARAWDEPDGVMARTVVPMSVFGDEGWRVAARDEFLRPDTTLEGLAALRTPFRAGGRVTAGQLGRADGRRHRGSARRRVGRGRARARAAMRLVGVRLHRRRAAPDGHRPRPGDRARPRAGRADDRRRSASSSSTSRSPSRC